MDDGAGLCDPVTVPYVAEHAREALDWLAAKSSNARNANAWATLRAYASDWNTFTASCDHSRLFSLPAEPRTVALYIADLAEAHKAIGLESHKNKPKDFLHRLAHDVRLEGHREGC